MIDAYVEAKEAQIAAAGLRAATQSAQAILTAATADKVKVAKWLYASAVSLAAVGEAIATGFAISAETRAQIASVNASQERRKQEWEFQKKLSQQDVAIGNQQIRIAEDQVAVVKQERRIAEIEAQHYTDILEFLNNKFT